MPFSLSMSAWLAVTPSRAVTGTGCPCAISRPICSVMACLIFSSLMMSISQPTSLVANLTFCPRFPIARLNWSSPTMTSILRFSMSVIRTCETFAGLRAFAAKTDGSSDHSIMSIFSPRSSLIIDCTRDPFIPTQAPTGSTSLSLDTTAILALSPGSRTALLMTTVWSYISGTSISKSLFKSSGDVRET